jgi:hypothetical protein
MRRLPRDEAKILLVQRSTVRRGDNDISVGTFYPLAERIPYTQSAATRQTPHLRIYTMGSRRIIAETRG